MDLEVWLTKENMTTTLFAQKLGVKTEAVYAWFRGKNRVNQAHLWDIWRLTNGEVLPSDLRPDLYPLKEMKQIYGCSACQDKPLESYQDLYNSLKKKLVVETKRFRKSKKFSKLREKYQDD